MGSGLQRLCLVFSDTQRDFSSKNRLFRSSREPNQTKITSPHHPGMLFTTPDLGNYISGAILYEETLFQNHADGTPFVDCLNKIGVIPGIKVDTGLSPLPGGHEVETWCSGLDGLVERAKKYYAQGARFAKWRAVLQITSDGAPSNLSIQVRHFQTLAFAI